MPSAHAHTLQKSTAKTTLFLPRVFLVLMRARFAADEFHEIVEHVGRKPSHSRSVINRANHLDLTVAASDQYLFVRAREVLKMSPGYPYYSKFHISQQSRAI